MLKNSIMQKIEQGVVRCGVILLLGKVRALIFPNYAI